jgi:sigma-54 dependent transcriptional regulator, acetoin dehydrogenase operon transcriptional activator AcoR
MRPHPPFGPTTLAMPPSSPFFSTREERVDEARQRYFEQGIRPSGLVGDPVIQSWTRCLKAGRRPTEEPVFDPISRSRALAVQERSQALLAAAATEIDQLDAALAGTGCKTLLTDRRGIVVRAGPGGGHGHGSGLLDMAGRIGVDLGEDNFGSTAPGIAVHDKLPCAVAGGEHFYGMLRQIHCAAAPIHNRIRQVVGVLDLSIEGRPFGFDAASLVRMSALAIENRLLAAPRRDQLVVAFQTRASLLDTPLVALLGVDAHGRLAWANAAAGTLLPAAVARAPEAGQRLLQAPPDVRDLLGLGVNELLRLAHETRETSRARVLPNGLMVWMRVAGPRREAVDAGEAAEAADATDTADTADRVDTSLTACAPWQSPPPPPQTDPPGTASDPARGSLDAANRALIEAALQRHKGNVSKAARELGVSRGLLYRRLHAWST